MSLLLIFHGATSPIVIDLTKFIRFMDEATVSALMLAAAISAASMGSETIATARSSGEGIA